MRTSFIVALMLLAQGCAHHQLGFITTKQAHTVEDVHTQQVLDNLAKFAHNPHALPHFSWPNSGASDVDSSVDTGAGFNFSPHRLTSWMFNVGGSRSIKETYNTTPINDPRKLELMRCAYQRAISSCCCAGESVCCPNCEKRFNKFYLGSENPSKVRETFSGKAVSEATVVQSFGNERYGLFEDVRIYTKRNSYNQVTYHLLDFLPGQQVDILYVAKEFVATEGTLSDEEKKLQFLLRTEKIIVKNKVQYPIYKLLKPIGNSSDEYKAVKEVYVPVEKGKPVKKEKALFVDGSIGLLTQSSGKVTSECLLSPCWFKVGEKCDMPKCSHCAHIGHYCGTYVWVPPAGRDQLAQLTLSILDIALNDPPAARTKEVVAYLDRNQRPTTKDAASYKVTAVVPISGSVKSVHPSAPSEAVLKAKRDFSAAQYSFDSLVTSVWSDPEISTELAKRVLELSTETHAPDYMPPPLEKFTREDLTESVADKEIQSQLILSNAKSVDEIDSIDKKILEMMNKFHELENAENYLHAIENAAAAEEQILEAERAELEYLPPVRTPVPNAGYLQFQQTLETLAPR